MSHKPTTAEINALADVPDEVITETFRVRMIGWRNAEAAQRERAEQAEADRDRLLAELAQTTAALEDCQQLRERMAKVNQELAADMRRAVEAEREECAKIADDKARKARECAMLDRSFKRGHLHAAMGLESAALVIRARSKTK